MGFFDRLKEEINKPRPKFRIGDEVENKLSNEKFVILDISQPKEKLFVYLVTNGKEDYQIHEALLKKHNKPTY